MIASRGALGWVAFVLGCGASQAAPPSDANMATAVDEEAARQRVLSAWGGSCARGTLECDGPPPSTRPATQSPPSGAAGFDLGMSVEDAEKRCRAAGQLWFSAPREAFTCSGSAGAPLPFHVDLIGCGGRVCRLLLTERVSAKPFERFAEIEKQLEGTYGAEHSHERGGERVKARDTWRWDNGHDLTVTLESPAPDDVFLVVVYSSPAFGEMLRTRGL